jgi:hypothetical protein
MVSIEATDRPSAGLVAGRAGPDDAPGGAGTNGSGADRSVVSATPGRRMLPGLVLLAVFLVSFGVRLLAHDVVITADEDNWMRRAGGFTFGLVNGQFGRMVDARPGFALVTALLVTLIAGLSWRLFGGVVGALTGLVVGLEPFLVGISQLVHMDALLSFSMVASVLMALVRWTRGGGRGWLIGSGVLAGLAILSKVPGVYMLAFVPALGVGLWILGKMPLTREGALHCAAPEPERRGLEVRGLALDVLVWGAATVLTYLACWPANWVLGPATVLDRVADFTKETGGQPHEQGTFFWGVPTADPGPLYYPVSMGFRLAPLTLLGLLLLILLVRRLRAQDRLPVLALVGYGLGFLLMMTLGAKKLDRYVLPIFPALGVLAAFGLALAYRLLADRVAGRGASTSSPPGLLAPVAAALAVLVAIWPAAATYPYFLAYFNPLLGGGPAAQRTIMVGNGEGLDQVATWLNAQPNASDLWVISHSFDILQPLIVASGEPLRDRVPSNADYVVLYRFQIQIAHSPRVLDEYLNHRTPEHVVWINGVEYARIYKGPHLRAAEAPIGVPASQPPGPRLVADDWSRPITLWDVAVKPRLRRIRNVVARIVPSDGAVGP